MHLHEYLAHEVAAWRAADYPSESFPAIGEILEWARETETGMFRFLREPQLRALETYWYLRLVLGTPHVFELYRSAFPGKLELLKALGLDRKEITDVIVESGGIEAVWERIRSDDDFVRSLKLEALRETLTLKYQSYILALAMGAGKTILIGSIVATEFAMALEYPGAAFVQNALVFAPGKTIIESLRELSQTPYDRILPPRLHKRFAASVKLTFTRDGEKTVPIIPGSLFNVVVTNTEKIRIQKETIRKSDLGLFAGVNEDEARSEVANLRLQAIASLPHLAVFSDEAHHTYGQSLEAGLKKVRKTVDYLAEQTNLICVVNTTGTPYFQRQPLRDVVIWYGLSEGIRDSILKDVAGNIFGYEFSGDTSAYIANVVEDFFRTYGPVTLPNGAPAKLAIYFPQTDDLRDLRPAIDRALANVGLSPALVLVNTSDESQTKAADIDAFNRLNDPASPHRVILLVNKGTEGWNCPSLFACALARKLKTSNNFVLQAATRCLRQVPGNVFKARIYLSKENYGILDRQLQETYGTTLGELSHRQQDSQRARVVLRKLNVPPLVVTRIVRSVVAAKKDSPALPLQRPPQAGAKVLRRTSYSPSVGSTSARVLRPVGDAVDIEVEEDGLDVYETAIELAARYRIDAMDLARELRGLYGSVVPLSDVDGLAAQVESRTGQYEIREERVDHALALVKPSGFQEERDAAGTAVYTAEIVYPKDREQYLVSWDTLRERNPNDWGFLYSPIRFASNPERNFFEQILEELNLTSVDVEDFYFTGGLTDPAKTDFYVEYRDDKGKPRRYTPDFLLRKRAARGKPRGSGKVFIVEIKSEDKRDHKIDGATGAKAMELRRWERLNPERLKYQMLFTSASVVANDQLAEVRRFAAEPVRFLPITLDRTQLTDFCRRWKIRKLEVFGSVLRPDFGPDSDVDFLATFEPAAGWTLFDEITMQDELAQIVGRRVDLASRRAVERSHNWIRRRSILEGAEAVHGS